MNRAILVRASIILGVLILAILIPVALEAFTQNEHTPQLSNPDDVYLTVDGIEVTNGDLWKTMKNIDGMDYLVDYTLEIILADEIAALTQEEIDTEILLLTYLTDDEEIIEKIMEDEDVHQDYLDSFRQNLIVLGYDPDSQESINEFVGLSIARRNYTEYLIDTAVDGSADYISENDVKDYYEDNSFGDVCTVDIRFSNSLEVTSVFNEFSLVANYNGGIGEYIGTDPIEDVLFFNDSNTLELSNNAVFQFYIKMYNLMNPWADPIPESISQEDYCANYADIAVKSYEDMTKNAQQNNPNRALAAYIFNTLSLDEDEVPYTYTNTKEFGDFTMLSFKVSQDEVVAFEDLPEAKQAEYRAELVELSATDAKIASTMENLLEENGFEIFDPQLKLKYEFAKGVAFNNKGSKTLVAKIDDKDITLDEFFAYMDGRIGVFYSVETAKIQVLLNSDLFVELYGDESNYFNSDNDDMKDHVQQLDEMKALFGTNYYANYGYSSADMTWEEFIYLAFSLETEQEVIENMFVIPALQNIMMHDEIEYEDAVAFMQDQIDTYFSLSVKHLLIYFDFDFDFAPDNFTEYMDELEGQELTDFNALLVDYRDLILAKIDEGKTFDEIVDEYSKALLNDNESEWAPFKQAGFFIKTEDLQEIDQISAQTLDENFADSLKRMYDAYVGLSEEEVYNDTQLTFSEFGVHYISATKGSNFEQFTAEYTDEDNEGDPENDNVLPSKEQVELYLEIKFAASKGENTTAMFHDDDVYAAVDYYYSVIYQAYLSQTAFGAYMGQYIIDANGVYATDTVEKTAQLQLIVDTLNEVNYPELFGTE